MKISEMLNTGKFTKFNFIKSRTYPYTSLSYILQKIPEISIEVQNIAKVEAFSMFFSNVIKIKSIARIEKIIKKIL